MDKMDIRDITRSVIEDYFSITGRPVATLTVEEYSKFMEMAKSMAGTISMTDGDMYRSKSEPAVPAYRSPQREEEMEEETEEKPDNKEYEKKAPSGIIPIKGNDTATPKQPTPAEKKKPSKEEMLKMLRSVSS